MPNKIGPREQALRALREEEIKEAKRKPRTREENDRGLAERQSNVPEALAQTSDGANDAPPAINKDVSDMPKKSKRTSKKSRKASNKSNGHSNAKSKAGKIGEMLLRSGGCTTKEVLKATGWPTVSMPAQAKMVGLKLRKEKTDSGIRYYGSK